VLSHDERGKVVSGSLETLAEAVDRGSEVKIGIRDLCSDLGAGPARGSDRVRQSHELLLQSNPIALPDDLELLPRPCLKSDRRVSDEQMPVRGATEGNHGMPHARYPAMLGFKP
jgi:hypothetical protein